MLVSVYETHLHRISFTYQCFQLRFEFVDCSTVLRVFKNIFLYFSSLLWTLVAIAKHFLPISVVLFAAGCFYGACKMLITNGNQGNAYETVLSRVSNVVQCRPKTWRHLQTKRSIRDLSQASKHAAKTIISTRRMPLINNIEWRFEELSMGRNYLSSLCQFIVVIFPRKRGQIILACKLLMKIKSSLFCS